MIRMVKSVIGHSYIIICIVLLLLVVACSTDDQTSPTRTSPDPGETVGISDDNPIVVMMKITPYNLRSFVFADVQGNIGYQYTGLTPIRSNNTYGVVPHNGSDGINPSVIHIAN